MVLLFEFLDECSRFAREEGTHFLKKKVEGLEYLFIWFDIQHRIWIFLWLHQAVSGEFIAV
jgi:hypothetical protein